MRAGRAVGLHDPLGEQIGDALARRRLVGAVEVVEAQVLADYHDHVPDRRPRGRRLSAGRRAAYDGDRERTRGEGCRAKTDHAHASTRLDGAPRWSGRRDDTVPTGSDL